MSEENKSSSSRLSNSTTQSTTSTPSGSSNQFVQTNSQQLTHSSSQNKKSVLSSLLDFLFGKDPDIFDDQGHVQHKLSKKKWDQWHQRTKVDPHYNWRNHTGISGNYSKRK